MSQEYYDGEPEPQQPLDVFRQFYWIFGLLAWFFTGTGILICVFTQNPSTGLIIGLVIVWAIGTWGVATPWLFAAPKRGQPA